MEGNRGTITKLLALSSNKNITPQTGRAFCYAFLRVTSCITFWQQCRFVGKIKDKGASGASEVVLLHIFMAGTIWLSGIIVVYSIN